MPVTRGEVYKKLQKELPANYYDLSVTLRGYLRSKRVKILDWKEAQKIARKLDPEGKNPMPIGVYYKKENAVWVHNNLYTDVYFKVLLHETAHFLLGHEHTEDEYEKYIQELEAETVAGLVCEKLKAGDLQQSAEYLQRKGVVKAGFPNASWKVIKHTVNTLLVHCFKLPAEFA